MQATSCSAAALRVPVDASSNGESFIRPSTLPYDVTDDDTESPTTSHPKATNGLWVVVDVNQPDTYLTPEKVWSCVRYPDGGPCLMPIARDPAKGQLHTMKQGKFKRFSYEDMLDPFISRALDGLPATVRTTSDLSDNSNQSLKPFTPARDIDVDTIICLLRDDTEVDCQYPACLPSRPEQLSLAESLSLQTDWWLAKCRTMEERVTKAKREGDQQWAEESQESLDTLREVYNEFKDQATEAQGYVLV